MWQVIFETFERFYLKENTIEKCYFCSKNLDNKEKYQCFDCEKLYCSSCFLLDIHIQKNFKNLKIITSKCPQDQNELIYYCLNCKKKFVLWV